MKLKSFVVAGLVAVTVSPAMAATTKKDIRKMLKNIKTEEGALGLIINSDRSTPEMRVAAEAKKAKLLNEMQVLQYEQCKKKKKGFFVMENGKGVCLTGNPCNSQNDTEKKYCVDTFKKTRVADIAQASLIIEEYAVNVLKWKGCAPLETLKKKQSGKAFITCTNPDAEELRVFEFKNVSEEDKSLSKAHFLYGLCVANGGEAKLPKKELEVLRCKNIDEDVCIDPNGINGTYDRGVCFMSPDFLDEK